MFTKLLEYKKQTVRELIENEAYHCLVTHITILLFHQGGIIMKAKKLLSIILSVLMLNFILPVVGESPVADGTTALASDQIYTYGS